MVLAPFKSLYVIYWNFSLYLLASVCVGKLASPAKMASKFKQEMPPNRGYGPIAWQAKIPKDRIGGKNSD